MSYTSAFTGAEIDAGIENAHAAVLRSGSAMTGPLILHDAPTNERGAATKKYVDESIPSALPNPNALTFTGAVSGAYDGASAKTFNIPTIAGKDGVSVTHSWNGTTLNVTSASGTSSADLKGSKGDTGAPGKYYIPTLSQDGYLSFKPSDGIGEHIAFMFSLKGEPGQPGQPGMSGSDGADGYSPVKGVDYWTVDDQEAIISEVMSILNASGTVIVMVDENNNIKLSGNLADGAYTLKYENADGSTTDICTMNVSGGTGTPDLPDEPAGSTNLFVASTCTLNKRINSSGVEKDQDQTFITDFIDIGDCMAKGGTNQIHIRNFIMYKHRTDGSDGTINVSIGSFYRGINYYDANGVFLGQYANYYVDNFVGDENGDCVITLDASKTTAKKIRVCGAIASADLTSTSQLSDCIITLNELITD